MTQVGGTRQLRHTCIAFDMRSFANLQIGGRGDQEYYGNLTICFLALSKNYFVSFETNEVISNHANLALPMPR